MLSPKPIPQPPQPPPRITMQVTQEFAFGEPILPNVIFLYVTGKLDDAFAKTDLGVYLLVHSSKIEGWLVLPTHIHSDLSWHGPVIFNKELSSINVGDSLSIIAIVTSPANVEAIIKRGNKISDPKDITSVERSEPVIVTVQAPK